MSKRSPAGGAYARFLRMPSTAREQALQADLTRVTAERDAAVDDANGNRLTSSWGPKDDTSPGEWARATCETVNALGGEKP